MLHYAVKNDQAHLIPFLIEQGWDINQKNQFHEVPLKIAVSGNLVNMVQTLLYYGANYDDQTIWDNHGPLHIAASKQYLECIKIFIGMGCNINAKNKNGETPLFCSLADENGN